MRPSKGVCAHFRARSRAKRKTMRKFRPDSPVWPAGLSEAAKSRPWPAGPGPALSCSVLGRRAGRPALSCLVLGRVLAGRPGSGSLMFRTGLGSWPGGPGLGTCPGSSPAVHVSNWEAVPGDRNDSNLLCFPGARTYEFVLFLVLKLLLMFGSLCFFWCFFWC